MKVIEGHLTAHDKKVIRAMFDSGQDSGRVGRTDFFIQKDEKGNTFHVTKVIQERHCIGAELKPSFYKSKFTL